MTPLKAISAGLAVGLVVYFSVSGIGGKFLSHNDDATAIIAEVTPSATAMSPGAKRLGTSVSPTAKTVSPSATAMSPVVSPTATTVTPRISLPIPTIAPTPLPTPSITITPRVSTSSTPSATPIPTQTPTPTPSDTPIATATPTPIPTDTPTTTPTPTATPTPTPSGLVRVVINEVAWAGTKANPADEWIELYNAGDVAVDLSGWSLQTEAAKLIDLHGIIAPREYFLVERSDDNTVSDILADVKGTFGGSGLSNTFERLWLQNTDGISVDEVAQCLDSKGNAKWCGGSASPTYSTMERISASGSGTDPANWATNNGTVTTGLDADQNAIRGTPKYQNSVL